VGFKVSHTDLFARSSWARGDGDARDARAATASVVDDAGRRVVMVASCASRASRASSVSVRMGTRRERVGRHRARGGGGTTRAREGDEDDDADDGEVGARARPLVVCDGANIAWCYSAALHAAFGSKHKCPLSRGVTAALEHFSSGGAADVVAFVPSTYVEGPLHGLCDGGSLDALVARHVVYLGNGRWRNERLAAEAARGRVKLVERDGKRSADDLTIIEYARKREAFIVSNDRYGDHKMGQGELKKYLKGRLFDYEFLFQTDREKIARDAGAASEVRVGSAFLPPPPANEGDGVNWDRKVHAEGSSRPWARYAKDQTWGKRPRMKKRRSMSKVVRVQQASSDDFPYWALDDELIPCTFNPSCKF